MRTTPKKQRRITSIYLNDTLLDFIADYGALKALPATILRFRALVEASLPVMPVRYWMLLLNAARNHLEDPTLPLAHHVIEEAKELSGRYEGLDAYVLAGKLTKWPDSVLLAIEDAATRYVRQTQDRYNPTAVLRVVGKASVPSDDPLLIQWGQSAAELRALQAAATRNIPISPRVPQGRPRFDPRAAEPQAAEEPAALPLESTPTIEPSPQEPAGGSLAPLEPPSHGGGGGTNALIRHEGVLLRYHAGGLCECHTTGGRAGSAAPAPEEGLFEANGAAPARQGGAAAFLGNDEQGPTEPVRHLPEVTDDADTPSERLAREEREREEAESEELPTVKGSFDDLDEDFDDNCLRR